jgi:hypothetical protein
MDKKDCDCIFCSCKCPECGSTDIEVEFNPCITLSNTQENKIVFSDVDIEALQIECNECGSVLDEGSQTRALRSALENQLSAVTITWNEADGSYSLQGIYKVSAKEG